MKTVNINYKCSALEQYSHLPFRHGSPRMYIHKCDGFKIIVFSSGKCRIMGCKAPLASTDVLPLGAVITGIFSVTVTFNLYMLVNLHKLARSCNSSWEPELFPALRLLDFKPLCVNVFGTGNVVILGLRNLHYDKIHRQISKLVYKHAN